MPRLMLNSRWVDLPAAADTSLLDFLRQDRGLTAAKPACGSGDCSACLVLVGEIEAGHTTPHYRALSACLLTTGQVADCHVITAEGLNGDQLTPVQQALVDQGGVQCGYCTPGLVVALTGALLNGQPLADAAGGNLCRCTGYGGIRRAMAAIRNHLPSGPFSLDQAADLGLLPPAVAQAGHALRVPYGELLHFPEQEAVIAGDTDWSVQHPHRVGGQSLLQLHHLPGLRRIEPAADGLRLGAAVTIEEFQRHPTIAANWPDLPHFLSFFASPAVRASATLGGNLVNASPVADMAVILLTLGAELTLAGPQGERRLPLADFYLGFHRTGLHAHELVTAIHLPHSHRGAWRLHAEKVARREHDDIASINSALLLGPGEAGHFGAVRLSAGGVGPVPMLLPKTAEFLVGKPITPATVRAASQLLGREVAPHSGPRGSGAYKRRLLQHLLVGHLTALCPQLHFADCLP